MRGKRDAKLGANFRFLVFVLPFIATPPAAAGACRHSRCCSPVARPGQASFKALFNVRSRVCPCIVAVPKEKTQDGSNLIYIYIGTSVFSVLMVIVGMGLLLYRRRKQAHFNEIPTVNIPFVFFFVKYKF